MSGYVRGLILTVVICNLTLLLVPSLHGDAMKKYVKYLCGLVVLLTLIAPVLRGEETVKAVTEQVRQFFAVRETTEGEEYGEKAREAILSGSVRETAYAVMAYLEQRYGIDPDTLSVTVVTEEEGEGTVAELRVYLATGGRGELREEIREDLASMTRVPVYVGEKKE